MTSSKDMAVLRRWDPALASLAEVTIERIVLGVDAGPEDLGKRPLEHLMAAVELSHRYGKVWHRDALEILTRRFTAEEIRRVLPRVAARITFEPEVLGDL